MTGTDINTLRRREEEAFAGVIAVQRKLTQGAPGVTLDALRRCKARLDTIQEDLLLAGELPGLFLRRYFYLIDRAEFRRTPEGTRIAFPEIAMVTDFRGVPPDERFLFDVERSLDLACAYSGGERLKTACMAKSGGRS
ncbi:hypothetical protein [Paraburkholderia megapolitana]|uniref:hypothetical protein n=1 Tax=Paraburkholderia megapolitana TaxID=420953 RepID=UPI0038B9C6A7